MATKADFSEAEWETLQRGVSGAGMLVSLADKGFLDTFKEAGAMTRHLKEAHEQSDSPLIRDLALIKHTGFGMTSRAEDVETETMAAIRSSLATLAAKAPDEIDAYRAFVLDVAESVAEAAKGIGSGEQAALEKLKAALAEAPDAGEPAG
jgi:hypothetical protein